MEQLRKHGYLVIDNYFSQEDLEKFEEEFGKVFREVKSEILDKEECSKDERIFHAEKYSRFIRNKFYDSPYFDKLCKEYTGKKELRKKTLINRVFYEKGKRKNSGAGWHRDNHDCQFKVIMYLTDVTERNGNFQWITNSSKKYIGYPKPRTPDYNTRFHDETIDEILQNKECNLTNLTGKRGTIIVADTTYIHRGNIIQEGERKAITQYFF